MSKGGGGGAGGGTQEVVQTTSNLPEYARPYFEEMLGRTMYETTRPYEAYPGQRLADFTQFERQAMQGLGTMQQPGQIGTATDIATRVGMGGGPTGFDVARGFAPLPVTTGYRAGDFDPGYQAGGYGSGYRASGIRSNLPGFVNFESGYTAAPTQRVDSLGRDMAEQYRVQMAQPGYQAGFLGQSYRPGKPA